MSLLIFVAYSFAKIYFLSKLKVNKWWILSASIAFLIAGIFMQAYTDNLLLNYLPTVGFVFLFLWYADLAGFGARKNKELERERHRRQTKNSEIRPKAKPNRLKYADDKDIVRTDTKKKKKK